MDCWSHLLHFHQQMRAYCLYFCHGSWCWGRRSLQWICWCWCTDCSDSQRSRHCGGIICMFSSARERLYYDFLDEVPDSLPESAFRSDVSFCKTLFLLDEIPWPCSNQRGYKQKLRDLSQFEKKWRFLRFELLHIHATVCTILIFGCEKPHFGQFTSIDKV